MRGDARPASPWARHGMAAWPAVLAVVLCWPLLTRSGYPLARDLVFVPHQPLGDLALGLGDGSPRAVPLDALVALLTTVVDGGALARLAVPFSVALAGWGVLRLLAGAPVAARLAASGLATWNPFVAERLALGQWALLVGYGCLPWVLVAAARHRREGEPRHAGAALGWAGLASITPTGGVLAWLALAAAGGSRTRRSLVLLWLGALLQAPWVLASLGAGSGTSDTVGVDAFAPDTDAPGGPVVALLGLGGIWDDASEPATRGTWVALAAAVVVLVLLAWGVPLLRRWCDRADVWRLVAFAAVTAVVPLLDATGPGRDVLAAVVRTVPGAGLARDSQKLLAPAVVLVALCLGAVAARVLAAAARHGDEVRLAGAVALVGLPVVVLPDATTVTWPTVTPVVYPAEVTRAYDALEGARRVVVLPWRAYPRFEWGTGATSSDPATRWVRAEVLTSDDLQVGPTVIRGESALRAEVGRALASGRPADVLGALGVDRVLVHRDQPGAEELDLGGLRPRVESDLAAVLDVPDARRPPAVEAWRRALVVAGHLLAGLVMIGGWVVAAGGGGAGMARAGRMTRREGR